MILPCLFLYPLFLLGCALATSVSAIIHKHGMDSSPLYFLFLNLRMLFPQSPAGILLNIIWGASQISPYHAAYISSVLFLLPTPHSLYSFIHFLFYIAVIASCHNLYYFILCLSTRMLICMTEGTLFDSLMYHQDLEQRMTHRRHSITIMRQWTGILITTVNM